MKSMMRSMNNRGAVLMVSVVVLLAVALLGMAMLANNYLTKSAALNFKHKLQSFYASEGLMTYLAQEVLDGRGDRYAGAGATGLTPIVELLFNEGAGSVTANTGSSKTAFPSGTLTATSPVWSTNAPSVGGGKCLDFGTSTSGRYEVDVPNGSTKCNALNGLKSFTVSGWLNCRSSAEGSGGNRIVGHCHGWNGNGLDLVYKSGGSLQLMVNNWDDTSPARSTGNQIPTSASAASSNWRFFAVTYDGTQTANNVKFYFGTQTVDATLDVTRTHNKGTLSANDHGLAIGNFEYQAAGMNDRLFRGLIDEIRVMGSTADGSGALSLADIVKLQKGGGSTRRDTVAVGTCNVRYSVTKDASDAYILFTEAYKTDAALNPSFLTPLRQTCRPKTDAVVGAGADSVRLPVTLYDWYEWDWRNNFARDGEFNGGGNPVFEQMVRDTLTPDRKPIATDPLTSWFGINLRNCWRTYLSDANWGSLTACAAAVRTAVPLQSQRTQWFFSDSIGTWFRPTKAPGATFDPTTGKWSGLVPYQGRANEFVGTAFDAAYAWRNVVTYDSITFRPHPTRAGVYQVIYTDTSANYGYFPLDGKGFRTTYDDGHHGGPHNYGFSMELHTTFTYTADNWLSFFGDDDVWVFINNRLVMDLGGVHLPARDSVSLGSLGLTVGQKYNLDFFFCERCAGSSNFLIQSNMDCFSRAGSSAKKNWKREYGTLD